jgi:hypothetical protein
MGGAVVLYEETHLAGGSGGQSGNQSASGRLAEFGDRLQFAGALEGGGERVVLRHLFVGFLGHHVSLIRLWTWVTSLHEPGGPERRVAAGITGVEGCGMGVDAVVPRWVAGDHPAFDIPQHPSGNAAEDGPERTRRLKPPGIGQVHLPDLPIDDVATPGTEAAERQSCCRIASILSTLCGAVPLIPLPQGDIDLGGAVEQRSGLGRHAIVGAEHRGGCRGVRIEEASHFGSFPPHDAEPVRVRSSGESSHSSGASTCCSGRR